jgi:hypothetical protein
LISNGASPSVGIVASAGEIKKAFAAQKIAFCRGADHRSAKLR